MARVTEAEVLEIIDTKLVAGEIDPFINTANLMVTNYISGEGLGDETLKEIEKYLSAHYLSCRDQRVKSEKLDTVSYNYTGSFGEGLKSTQYGQTAIMLDTSGTLGKMADNNYVKKASISMMEYHES